MYALHPVSWRECVQTKPDPSWRISVRSFYWSGAAASKLTRAAANDLHVHGYTLRIKFAIVLDCQRGSGHAVDEMFDHRPPIYLFLRRHERPRYISSIVRIVCELGATIIS